MVVHEESFGGVVHCGVVSADDGAQDSCVFVVVNDAALRSTARACSSAGSSPWTRPFH